MLKPGDVDELLAAVTVGASGDDDVLRAFHARLTKALRLPAMALLTGRRVQVVAVEYLGNPRRGLTIRAFEGERQLTASILDLTVPGKSAAALTLAALKRWAGAGADEPARDQIEAAGSDIIEACVTKVGSIHVRLRALASPQEVTYRSSGSGRFRLVPGHVVRVKPSKRWTHRGVPYVTGEVLDARVDVAALRLPPLGLRQEGTWTPKAEESFFDDGSLAELWREVVEGPRTEFVMEQVLPGVDPDDVDGCPIVQAAELYELGDREEASDALMALVHKDLRCIDAHAHLGNWAFESSMLDNALAHYEVGLGLGEQALGTAFSGLLPWGLLDNRPLLRCLNGRGLALWRLKRLAEAQSTFERLLRLNPRDNQGARFNWTAIRYGRCWEDETHEEPSFG